MAFGDSTDDKLLKDAWDGFCDRLKEAGNLVFRDDTPPTPFERATGFRYLSRQINRGLQTALEYADPLFPEFKRTMHPRRKFGGDNADALNMRATIDGKHTYRVVGNRGSAHYISFSLHAPNRNIPWQHQEIDRLLGDEIATEWDGSFQVILSPEQHDGNWLKTTPETNQLSIRQFFGSWDKEFPMTIRIEREGSEGESPAQITPEVIANALGDAADLVFHNAAFWIDWVGRYRASPNTFMESVTQGQLGATPGGKPIHCHWMIQPDEALLIQFTPPKAYFWNIELNNFWMETLDYRYQLSGTNSKLAVPESDGSYNVVVASTDPGLPNWIETGGHLEGHLTLRWVQGEASPLPETHLAKVSDLDSFVPKNLKRITPKERQEQKRLRSVGAFRRFRV